MSFETTTTWRGRLSVVDPVTHLPANADGLPTAALNVDGSDVADVVSVTAITTGSYALSAALSSRTNGEVVLPHATVTIDTVDYPVAWPAFTIDATVSSQAASSPLQHEIDNSFVFQLPSRESGVYTARNTIVLSSQSERPRFAYNMRPISKTKPLLVTNVTVYDSADVETADFVVTTETDTANTGVRDHLVLSKVSTASVAGTFTVAVTVTTADASTYVLKGSIVVPAA